MKNGVYFETTQMTAMAEFIAALRVQMMNFEVERDDHRGFWVIVN